MTESYARPRTLRGSLPFLLAAAAVLLAATHPAVAQTTGGGGNFTTFLQNIANIITGTAGQVLAVIAVAIGGIGMMFGAMSISTLGRIILGCAIVFSAAWIVGQLTGGGTTL